MWVDVICDVMWGFFQSFFLLVTVLLCKFFGLVLVYLFVSFPCFFGLPGRLIVAFLVRCWVWFIYRKKKRLFSFFRILM